MRLTQGIALTALFLLATASAAFAGDIHPALATRLEATPANEMISAIVIMAEQAPIARMNEELKTLRASRQYRHREVVLALQEAARSQDDLKSWLAASERGAMIEGYTSYWIGNLMVVLANPEAIAQIAARPDVDWVELNFSVSLIEPTDVRPVLPGDETAEPTRGVTPGLVACRVPEVWHGLGITGAGAIIASMDTGVNGNHVSLSNRWRGLHAPASECWLDVLGGGTTFPVDNHGHGTHTTGTMAGVAGTDSIGVAYEAEWIACNAIDQGVGSGFDNDVITGFQWFADPDGNSGTVDDVPDVVQNSWRINEGFGGDYTDCDTRWWAVIDNAEAAGVVTTWSAGNEGPGSTSIGSPADRATTAYNCFSVGAVDATNDTTFPYNMASFSSRGPTGCDVAPELKIKPEIVGPGVDVYSAAASGGYTYMSGTSMSGPHLAGIVGLMRSANPDIDVDTVKLIIMQTARDQDSAGEDNTSGWGMVDAYAAVLGAMEGFGNIEGQVTNASNGGTALPGASVELLGSTFHWLTDDGGLYAGMAAADTYTARASRQGFASQDAQVTIEANGLIVQDFSLTDIAGPEISDVTDLGFTSDTAGPYAISATVQDFSGVDAVLLYYRVNMASWVGVPMVGLGTYSAQIPGAPAHSQIDFYVHATDGLGLVSTAPPTAPMTFYSFYITELAINDDIEGGQGAWTVESDAGLTTGAWEWADPVGTTYNGDQMAPEDDHTVNPGVYCFVTDNGAVGGAPGDNDVDNGCTRLFSPVYALSSYGKAFISYWRWYAEDGYSTDDEFVVDVTGDGVFWYRIDTEPDMANSWTRVQSEISALVDPLTDQVQFRFTACDLNSGGLVEAGIDDLSIEVLQPDLTAAPGDGPQHWSLQLLQSQPNPFHPGDGPVTLRFSLGQAGPARVQVFDISGRLVRTLADGARTPGEHAVRWDGKDARGNAMSSGVYFYRLEANGGKESKSLVLLR